MNDRQRSPAPRIAILGRLPRGTRGSHLRRLVEPVAGAVGREPAEVAIRFACDRTVRRYNRIYRGVDRATDVLSFPSGDAIDPALGDILISRERVLVQARAAGWSPRREAEELVIHGLLHLMGFDHETDAGEMDAIELRLRRRLLDGADAGGRR